MDDRQIKSEISEIWNTGAETYDTFVSHGIQTDEERESLDCCRLQIPSSRKGTFSRS